MATTAKTKVKAPKNRLSGECTEPVQNGSNSGHTETKRRNITIQYLHALGKTNAEIAKHLNVHRNLVSQVVKDAPPPAEEMLATLKRLDEKAVGEIESALDCGDHKYALPAAEFYLTRRSILGEPEDKGAKGGSQTVINIFNDLKEGLAKLNYGLPSPN